MSERVVVHMNSDFGTYFTVSDPDSEPDREPRDVSALHQLTPYGMLLTSLGTCTAMVVHTYARNRDLPLDEVELILEFGRAFDDDCENCEHIDHYDEVIREEIRLQGNLSAEQRDKLFQISHQCPINKMLQAGTKIDSRLLDTPRA